MTAYAGFLTFPTLTVPLSIHHLMRNIAAVNVYTKSDTEEVLLPFTLKDGLLAQC